MDKGTSKEVSGVKEPPFQMTARDILLANIARADAVFDQLKVGNPIDQKIATVLSYVNVSLQANLQLTDALNEDRARLKGIVAQISGISKSFEIMVREHQEQTTAMTSLQNRLQKLEKEFEDEIKKLTHIFELTQEWMRKYQPVLDKVAKEVGRVSKL